MNKINSGFTLIEMLMVIMLIAALMGAMFYIFQTVLLSWSNQYTRTEVNTASSFTITSMVKDLKEAKAISDNNHSHEIRFAIKQRDASGNSLPISTPENPNINYYIYYFYNAKDTYPPKFNQNSYQLWRSQLFNVTNNDLTTGTFTYGPSSSGQFIVDNVISPTVNTLPLSTNLSVDTNTNVITIALNITKGSETIKDYSNVSPRNLNNQ